MRRRHCRQAVHKSYLAHDCPDFDGLRICVECEEFLHSAVASAHNAAERRSGRLWGGSGRAGFEVNVTGGNPVMLDVRRISN